ncbi:RNA polymerase sigma factor [Congregicoccus parvus]|uniref:RNA polymerase sigma factor n=1 Tax=Congregicoccus parvus TaxID=3081749 RepID=UPI003FA5B740
MSRVKQGDLDALAPIFERHQAPLLNFFHRLSGDRETSRDLVQVTFERLIRYRSSYREEGCFRAWMYRAARNAFYDHHRRSSRMRVVEPDEETGDAADVADHGWREERRARDLDEALGQLDESDRDLIVLSRFHGLQYDEIAAIMDKSIGAVKTRAHRALHTLRRVYFQEETT